jgi:hypothetical protein
MDKNIASGVGLLIFSVVYWLGAGAIPKSALSGNVGADGLPKLLAITLAVLATGLILQSYLLRRRSGSSAPPQLTGEPAMDPDQNHVLALGILAIGTVFAIALEFIGYYASVALLLIAVARFYDKRITPGLIVYGLVGSAIIYFIFVWTLGVMMPAGIWFDLKSWF